MHDHHWLLPVSTLDPKFPEARSDQAELPLQGSPLIRHLLLLHFPPSAQICRAVGSRQVSPPTAPAFLGALRPLLPARQTSSSFAAPGPNHENAAKTRGVAFSSFSLAVVTILLKIH